MPRKSAADLTEKEMKILVKEIIKRNGYHKTRNLDFYKKIASDYVINGRSASALKLGFYQQIMPNISRFCNTHEAIMFRQYFDKYNPPNITAKTTKSYAEVDLDSDSDQSTRSPLSSNGQQAKKRPATSESESSGIKKNKFAAALEESDDEQEEDMVSAVTTVTTFSVGRVLSGKVKADKVGTALASTSFAKPLSQLNSKNMLPTVNLIDCVPKNAPASPDKAKKVTRPSEEKVSRVSSLNETKSTGNKGKRSVTDTRSNVDKRPAMSNIGGESLFSLSQALCGRVKLDRVGNDLIRGVDNSEEEVDNSSDTDYEPMGNTGKSKENDGSESLSDSEDDEKRTRTPRKAGSDESFSPESSSLSPENSSHNDSEEPIDLPGSRSSPRKKEKQNYTESLSSSDKVTKKTREPSTAEDESQFHLSCILDGSTSRNEATDIIRKHTYKKPPKAVQPNKSPVKVLQKKAEAKIPKSPEITTVEDEEDLPVEAQEKSVPVKKSKNAEPLNHMVAVGRNLHGEKCFFRLTPMTKEEIDAMQGPCIPFQLHAAMPVLMTSAGKK